MRSDTTSVVRATSTVSHPSTVVAAEPVTRWLATNSAGIVMTSPSVAVVGATRLSMSQPRRTDSTASTTVAASTMLDASRPPMTEMRVRSRTEMLSGTPNPTATIFARTASTRDSTTVSDIDATTF